MNERTAKLLSKYAAKSGKAEKELKTWWKSLDFKQRTRERKRMQSELK